MTFATGRAVLTVSDHRYSIGNDNAQLGSKRGMEALSDSLDDYQY